MPTSDERFDGLFDKADQQEKNGNEEGAQRLRVKGMAHAAKRADNRDRRLVPVFAIGMIAGITAAVAAVVSCFV